MFQTVTIFRP